MSIRPSGADSLSLHAQKEASPAHTIALIVMEASDRLSHDRLHQLVASSLPKLARFRSRLVDKAMGLGHPVWAEIEDYDPTPHIHRAAVDPPGGQRELAALIAQLSAARPRGRRLLWEAWSIEGLAGGRWALAVKTLPVLSERGNGAVAMWQRLLTSKPHDPLPATLPAEPGLGAAPSIVEVAADLLAEIFAIQVMGVSMIAATATHALQALHRRLRGSQQAQPLQPPMPSMTGPVPRSVFNAPLTQRRAVAFASIPLSEVEKVSDAFGGSTANVFLAACTLSLRAWLLRYDSVPASPLQVQVPLSLPAGDPAMSGNPMAVGPVRLPVQLDDPVQVLSDLHTATERLTIAVRDDAETSYPATDFATFAALVPPPVAQAAAQLYRRLGLSRLRAPSCHGSVSYLSGNRAQTYCAGAEVIAMHTAAPLLDGRGLNVTVTPHDDVMDLCVCVCPDNVPGVDDIATGIAESVDLLVAAARASPRGQGRSIVSEMASHVGKRSQVRRL